MRNEFGQYNWISGKRAITKNGVVANYAKIVMHVAKNPGLNRPALLIETGIKEDYRPTVDRGYYSCCFRDLLALKLIKYDKDLAGYVLGSNYGAWIRYTSTLEGSKSWLKSRVR